MRPQRVRGAPTRGKRTLALPRGTHCLEVPPEADPRAVLSLNRYVRFRALCTGPWGTGSSGCGTVCAAPPAGPTAGGCVVGWIRTPQRLPLVGPSGGSVADQGGPVVAGTLHGGSGRGHRDPGPYYTLKPAGDFSSAGRGLPGNICPQYITHLCAWVCACICLCTSLWASRGLGALAGACREKTQRWPAPAVAGVRV